MKSSVTALGGALLCAAVLASGKRVLLAGAPAAAPGGEVAPAVLPSEAANAIVGEYCVACHNDAGLAGGRTFEKFDAARAGENAETAEKMIRKLRAGMMPPSYAMRPEETELQALAASLEVRVDEMARSQPNPGKRTFQRLNRAEYQRSIRDLLMLDVDVNAFLPPDTVSHGFDNIADVQNLSPTLMEGYLRAANKISREAVGDPEAAASEATFKVPRTSSQLHHVEGAPFGTRGGISVVHNFPADGDYIFKIQLHGGPTGILFGSTTKGEQLEVSVNGRREALLDINPRMTESDPNGLTLRTGPIAVKAGPQRVSAAFIQRFSGPVDDLISPIEHTLADTQIGSGGYGITTLPHLRDLSISGPYHVTGVSDTPSRRTIFICRPTSKEDEFPCAQRIVAQLASRAFRRPVDELDLEGLMSFYEAGARERDFESGIRTALQAILASPHFVFRVEQAAGAVPGRDYPIGDLDLASRLSFFLWASAPDDELARLAAEGVLNDPEVLENEARRMLGDRRSEALATRFAAQWLRLQDLERLHPDALLYPQYDQTLAEAMRRETELFFEHLVREDRSVLELLTADYTFVNERLAKHYGIRNVTGNRFRRVALEDQNRRGLLGHGSILTQTSVADRTSPVQRGKWVLEVLLGSPPPPPPPDVPDFNETKAVADGKLLTVRERMEEHRSNPACQSCHQVIDPIGLALENFDVTGVWRTKDSGAPVDATGELYDGTTLDGPAGLRQALLHRSDVIITNFTESLMTYGLGRRVEFPDMPAVRNIVREAAAHDNRISSFILGVVKSAAFRMKRAEPAEVSTAEVH
jgi:mono/diheme cytochrome c family protein